MVCVGSYKETLDWNTADEALLLSCRRQESNCNMTHIKWCRPCADNEVFNIISCSCCRIAYTHRFAACHKCHFVII